VVAKHSNIYLSIASKVLEKYRVSEVKKTFEHIGLTWTFCR